MAWPNPPFCFSWSPANFKQLRVVQIWVQRRAGSMDVTSDSVDCYPTPGVLVQPELVAVLSGTAR